MTNMQLEEIKRRYSYFCESLQPLTVEDLRELQEVLLHIMLDTWAKYFIDQLPEDTQAVLKQRVKKELFN